MDKCKICMDLLPLVIDGVASEESKEFFFKNYKDCPECVKAFESENLIEEDIDDKKIIGKIQKKMWARTLILLFIGMAITLATFDNIYIFSNIIILPILGIIFYKILGNKSYIALISMFIIASLSMGFLELMSSTNPLEDLKYGFFGYLVYGGIATLLVAIGMALGKAYDRVFNSKNNKKEKIITSVIALVLVGFLLFMTNGFYGNPVSKFLAERNTKAFMEEKFPEERLIFDDTKFDFKTGGYSTNVEVLQKKDYEFTVYTNLDGSVRDKYFDGEKIVLENVIWRLSDELEDDILFNIRKLDLENEISSVFLTDNIFEEFSSSGEPIFLPGEPYDRDKVLENTVLKEIQINIRNEVDNEKTVVEDLKKIDEGLTDIFHIEKYNISFPSSTDENKFIYYELESGKEPIKNDY